MSSRLPAILIALAAICCVVSAAAQTRIYGQPASAELIHSRDITVFPDGTGLPPGSGDAKAGARIFEVRCVRCHNTRGTGRQGQYPALAGGVGSLATKTPKKTVGSYWPRATTVWDFINRAMPFNQPRSLPPNDVYALTAYVLFLNGIVGESEEMNQRTLPLVKMPNRDGFVRDPRAEMNRAAGWQKSPPPRR